MFRITFEGFIKSGQQIRESQSKNGVCFSGPYNFNFKYQVMKIKLHSPNFSMLLRNMIRINIKPTELQVTFEKLRETK